MTNTYMKIRQGALYATILMCAGCTPTPEQQLAAVESRYRDKMVRIEADYESAMAKVRNLSEACRQAIAALKIGSQMTETATLPCKPDHINTTVTKSITHDQWVYGLADGERAYLYYENGTLVAVQF